MLTAALIGIIEDACQSVRSLTDGVSDETLHALRLTRDEARRQLLVIADVAASLAPDARATLAGVDWDGWALTARHLRGPSPEDAAAALFHGVRALVPATLAALARHRHDHPNLFAFKP